MEENENGTGGCEEMQEEAAALVCTCKYDLVATTIKHNNQHMQQMSPLKKPQIGQQLVITAFGDQRGPTTQPGDVFSQMFPDDQP